MVIPPSQRRELIADAFRIIDREIAELMGLGPSPSTSLRLNQLRERQKSLVMVKVDIW